MAVFTSRLGLGYGLVPVFALAIVSGSLVSRQTPLAPDGRGWWRQALL
jgi:hypothetical protein